MNEKLLTTEDGFYRTLTHEFLRLMAPQMRGDPDLLTEKLYSETVAQVKLRNAAADKSDRWPIPRGLTVPQIADILLDVYDIKNIMCAGTNSDKEYDLLGLYHASGPSEGIYTTDEASLFVLAQKYNYNLTSRQFDDLYDRLRRTAPRAPRCEDRDLVAVNNGVFDYGNKQLLPFSPDMVFLAKSHVNYVPNAPNPVIHNADDGTDWDVESWMAELSDDPDIVDLLWQVLGAIVRPNVRWNKSAWLYSQTGNNGKGTLCELMRNLCGHSSYASVSISDFSKDFMLEPLTRATAIIVDENDVGTFIDKVGNLKAVITNDVIQINRKFKQPIPYQFHGFMVQCLNEFPRIKDKSDSFYRRQLFIPFDKCFTGKERRYIKDDYLKRQDVLEHVLSRVLEMDYYVLSEPAACVEALADYKEYNDSVRMFFNEFKDQFVWDLLPFGFLYDLYKAWFAAVSPSGTVISRNSFINDLCAAVSGDPDWSADRKRLVRTGHAMDAPEFLIGQYQLKAWMNPAYVGHDLSRICTVRPAASYRGVIRVTPSAGKAGAITGQVLPGTGQCTAGYSQKQRYERGDSGHAGEQDPNTRILV